MLVDRGVTVPKENKVSSEVYWNSPVHWFNAEEHKPPPGVHVLVIVRKTNVTRRLCWDSFRVAYYGDDWEVNQKHDGGSVVCWTYLPRKPDANDGKDANDDYTGPA